MWLTSIRRLGEQAKDLPEPAGASPAARPSAVLTHSYMWLKGIAPGTDLKMVCPAPLELL